MKFKDGVSIIVTVYNKEKFVKQTLESVFIQMKKSSQLIIVDDGSTDSSLEIIKRTIKRNSLDIKLISQKNSGPSVAINNALNFVKYSYVKFVDGDDIIAPDSLEYMKKEMERLKIDLLYGYWEWSNNIKNFIFKKTYYPAKIIHNALERFLIGGWGGSSNLMVKAECLLSVGGCDEKVFIQDFSIPMRIAGYHLKIKTNKMFTIGQSNKTICVGPAFLENRVMDNNGQTLYDLSLAALNFIEQHPLLNNKLVLKCKKKILARCWSWQRKKNGLSFFSKNFFYYLVSKFWFNYSVEHLRLIVFETWKNQTTIKKFDYTFSEKKKILIYVGLDLLGDALLKLPLLKCIKNIYPNSHVTWLAGKGKSVFKTSLKPLASNLIDKIQDDARIGSHISELFLSKKVGKYDIVLDTQKRLLTTLILKKIPAKIFVSPCCNFFLSDLFPSRNNEKNLARQLLSLGLLFSNQNFFPDSWVMKKKKSRKIIICPGASVTWKRWPLEKFIEVGKFLESRNFLPVFVLGPKEEDYYKILRKVFESKGSVVKSFNPMKTIKIAKLCKLGISNDTGCGHLLASSGIPIITLFGPTNCEKFSPIGNTKNLVVSSQKLYGSKNINKITVSLIKKKIASLLK